MSPEKQSNVQIVRSALTRVPRYMLPSETGLSRTQVSTSISYLRRMRELPRPTEEESRKTMSESVSSSKGGTRLIIEPYLGNGMNESQIIDIVYLEQGIVLDLDKVKASLHHFKHKSKYPRSGKPLNRTPIQAIEARKGIDEARYIVKALALRKADSAEIIRIMRYVKLTKAQVESMMRELGMEISKPREKDNPLKRRKMEEIHAESITFRNAREVVKSGFITENTAYWEEVEREFSQRGESIPSLAYGIIEEEKKIAEKLRPLKSRRADRAEIRMLLSVEEPSTRNENSRNMILLARKIFASGFLTEELAFWNLGKGIAEKLKKPWFENVPSGILVETLMIAKYQEMRHKNWLMKAFNQWGNEIDPNWFNSIEKKTERFLICYEVEKRFKSDFSSTR